MTVGLELPLDNDWSPAGDAGRRGAGRPFGVPDLAEHAERAQLADRLGFATLWLRDVPLYEPGFGDAGQVFDAFSYLGFLAGRTKEAALGTAAIALPLRHPLHVAKAAATVDQLSGGRLVLGLATGDRPVEFPLFGADFEGRGGTMRDGIALLRAAWAERSLPVETPNGPLRGIQVLPKPAQERLPLVMAGRGRQTLDWVAANMDGKFDYPRDPRATAHQVAEWRAATEATTAAGVRKPFITAFRLDLAEDPDAGPTPHQFGARMGRNRFLDLLEALDEAGVNHVAIHLRHSRRPIEECLHELAEYALDRFPTRRAQGALA